MSFADLNLAAAADRGFVLEILHPDTRVPLTAPDGTPVTLTLLGRDSEAFIQAERRNREKAVDNLTSGVKYKAAEADRISAETMADITKAWTGIPKAWLDPTGEDKDETLIPLSKESALKLYANRGVKWLSEQAEKALNDRGKLLRA